MGDKVRGNSGLTKESSLPTTFTYNVAEQIDWGTGVGEQKGLVPTLECGKAVCRLRY